MDRARINSEQMVRILKKLIGQFISFLHEGRLAWPLGVFRIVFFSIMFLEVLDFEELMPLLVDETPLLNPSDWNYHWIFGFWKVVLAGVILGLPSKFWRIANWVFAVGFFNSVDAFEYHMFYAWTGVSFISIFLQCTKSLSVDRVLDNVKRARSGLSPSPLEVTNWDYYLPLLVGVGFVYADSVLWKLTDPAWTGGLGMYRPCSLPFISYDSFLTGGKDTEVVFRALGMLTLVFEFLFIFLIPTMLKKKWLGLVSMAIGIGLHGGIALLLPLPLFGWGYASLFILLLPPSLLAVRTGRKKLFVFYYDAECPLCTQTKALLQALDWFCFVHFQPVQSLSDEEISSMSTTRQALLSDIGGKWTVKGSGGFLGIDTYKRVLLLLPLMVPLGILLWAPGIQWIARQVYGKIAARRAVNRCTFESCGIVPVESPNVQLIQGLSISQLRNWSKIAFLVLVMLVQGLVSHNSGILKRWSKSVDRKFLAGNLSPFVHLMESKTKPLFGITNHALFMSYHFKGFSTIGNLEGESLSWPLDNGMNVLTNSGPAWAVWTWRIHGPSPRKNSEELVSRFKVYFEEKYQTELEYVKYHIPEYDNVYDKNARQRLVESSSIIE